jgi:hypothetical protein
MAMTAFLIMAAAALYPLRLAGLEHYGVTARAAEGTIWQGRLRSAQIHGVPVGDLDVRLSPVSLLGRQLQTTFASGSVRGSIVKQAGGIGLKGLNGRTGAVTIGGLPVTAIEFYNVDVGFADQVCVTASGQVRVHLAKGLTNGADLTGSPKCDGPTITLPLASESGQVRLALNLDSAGRYRATLAIDGVSDTQRPSLLVAGFRQTPTGMALAREGTF